MKSKPNKTATLQLRDIRINGATQMRAGIDDEHIERLMHAIDEGLELPPLDVFEDTRGIIWLADGFHRYEAAKRRGIGQISVSIWYGSKRDAVIFATGANADHGLPRSREDKRRAVLALLADAEWAAKSDREIARQARVSHPMVATLRPDKTAKTEPPRSGNFTTRDADRSDPPSDVRPKATKPKDDFVTINYDEPRGPEPFEAVELKPEPVPASAVVSDQPDGVAEALATKTWAAGWKVRMTKLFEEFLEAARGPGGAWYAGQKSAVEAGIDQAKGGVDAAIPHAACPYCEGNGCERCRNTGVMPSLVHQSAVAVIERYGRSKT